MDDGQTLNGLCTGREMSRQAASKHLRILEEAGLIVSHRTGREKLHYLNPVPIREIGERWISKYAERKAGAMTALKKALEEDMTEDPGKPVHIYETFIKASPERVWEALTTPEFTKRYFHATHVASQWRVGAPVTLNYTDGQPAVEGVLLKVDRPRTLSFTWRALYDETYSEEKPSRVTFRIEPNGEVSKLTVVHDEFEADSKLYPVISKGWSEILCSLKSLLETGEPLPIAGNQ